MQNLSPILPYLCPKTKGMPHYLLMRHPGHNRVYYESSRELALAELTSAIPKLEGSDFELSESQLGGISYISLKAETELSIQELKLLGSLSFVYALFRESQLNDQACLIPLENPFSFAMDEKFSSLMRYSGKTNELFTRFMINLAALSSDFNPLDRLRLVDPVAGKGTTLIEGALRGYDTFGVEIQKKAQHEGYSFIRTYLKRERYTFRAERRQVSGAKGTEAIYMDGIEYARNRAAFENPDDPPREIGMICGNTLELNQYFKKGSFHLLVGDLPYGVQHGSRTQKGKARQPPLRNPSELLGEALPSWLSVLTSGGCMVLAWNSLVSPRAEMIAAAARHGLNPVGGDHLERLSHRVDQSIRRDVLVFRKP